MKSIPAIYTTAHGRISVEPGRLEAVKRIANLRDGVAASMIRQPRSYDVSN